MLLKVDLQTRMIERVRGEKLRLFNVSEDKRAARRCIKPS